MEYIQKTHIILKSINSSFFFETKKVIVKSKWINVEKKKTSAKISFEEKIQIGILFKTQIFF